MALFKVTTRARKLTNGIMIEPGMTVEISAISAIKPLLQMNVRQYLVPSCEYMFFLRKQRLWILRI